MISTGKRIKELRIEKRLTQKELGKQVNVSAQVISNWERGYTPNINHDDLIRLADALETSVNYLLCRTNDPSPLPPGSIPVTDWVRIPIYGEIRAGLPMLVQEEIIGWEYVPAEDVKGGEYFFLKVKGDSMINARIQEGDLVLVRRQDILENGQIGVVVVNGEATIKKFYRQGMNVVLQPANPAYAPIVARIQDVRIIGEVVEAKIKFNGR